MNHKRDNPPTSPQARRGRPRVRTSRPTPNSEHEVSLMSKLSLDLSPTPAVSKPARQLWQAAFSMSRRMMRAGTRHGTGDLYAYYLAAAHRRFGDAAMPVA